MSAMPALGDFVEVTTVRRGKVTDSTTSNRLVLRLEGARFSISWPPDSDTTVEVVKRPLPTAPESRVRTNGVLWCLATGGRGNLVWVPCATGVACGGWLTPAAMALCEFTVEYDAGAGA